VVKQAVSQTYTYYTPDSPQGIVIEDSPLQGRGRAWTLGEYRHPVYPSPLNVRVGDAGIHVSLVVSWLRSCGDDVDLLLERYGQLLTREDVEAAQWYYRENGELIDRELREEALGA